jgi:hypothetical protein
VASISGSIPIEKGAQTQDRIRREKCARVGKEIWRAAARAERDELVRRGVHKDRRRPNTYLSNLMLANIVSLSTSKGAANAMTPE